MSRAILTGSGLSIAYAQQCGADEVHLVIFNRDTDQPWDEKIWQRNEVLDGQVVMVWGA